MKLTNLTLKEVEELCMNEKHFQEMEEEFFWQKMVELFHTPEEAT